MAFRHKILLHTNFPLIKSGLAENGRILAKYLDLTGKYDIVYLGSQASESHTETPKLPYRTIGVLPASKAEQERIKAQDQLLWRDTCYGGPKLHKVIEEEKPTIYLGSDDIWAFQPHIYNSKWFERINSLLHITVDSLPISNAAYEQAKKTKKYFTWAKFAQKEMARNGATVNQIYGASDTEKFKPIDLQTKNELRKKFGLDENELIFIYLGRNQLRKEFGSALHAFRDFQKENPRIKAKLLLHTSFAEIHSGWDIPKIIKYFGLNNDDILTTMFCRQCGQWEVKPYAGENTDCQFCGTSKSQVSCTIAHGVEHDELHLVYGLADAAISPFTSGGLEFHNVNSLLCGLPLACTNYSCGEDFCEQPFVYPIKWHPRFEHSTTYLKATNDVDSIKEFFIKMSQKSYEQRRDEGAIGNDWAKKTFAIETIGKQWEDVFDSLPNPDWSSIDLSPQYKNADFEMPEIEDDTLWVKELYKKAFDINVQDNDKGLNDWLTSLRNGRTRWSIYRYFILKAEEENAKLRPPVSIETLFTQNDRKRILVVMRESGGDLYILSSLLKPLKDLYPDADLYIACDKAFHDIFAGNEYVHKVLDYAPEMENEMAMMKYVDYFYLPGVATQRHLNYLTHDKIGVDL